MYNKEWRIDNSRHCQLDATGGLSPALGEHHWLRYVLLLLIGMVCLFGASYSQASRGVFSVLDPQQFTDKDGQPFNEERLQGKIVLINFIFTHCSHVCPTQVHSLVNFNDRLAPQLRRNIHLLSVSLDPENDTPEVLKAYSTRLGADSDNWSFISGPAAHVKYVMEQLRLMNPSRKTPELDDHKSAIWLVDQQGRVMQRYQGNSVDIDRLLAEVQQLNKLRSL